MLIAIFTIPSVLIFLVSFFKNLKSLKIMPILTIFTAIPPFLLFFVPKPFNLWGNYLIIDSLGSYILIISAIVSIGISLSLLSLEKRVSISAKAYMLFYRFFSIFWLGVTLAILANNMGIYWIGLEMGTLATVYMIKVNNTKKAHKEAWNYMIIGAIGVSLILFGIILIYASAKPILGENAMEFDALLNSAKSISSPFLFEIGLSITIIGMFIKMGFFPMGLWLPDIERSAYYPIAAIFSGILESAVIIGFFRFTQIAKDVNFYHIFSITSIYVILTIGIISFLIFRTRDFIRIFSLSGIEHMAIIALFWIAGGTYAALLHFGAHAFFKPGLFLSTGELEAHGQGKIAGSLKGFKGIKGRLFGFLITFFLLGIVSIPPSPMFFSELSGFGSIINVGINSSYLVIIIIFVVLLLIFLSGIFYRFISIYQSMRYEGSEKSKKVYTNELIALLIYGVGLILLLTPKVTTILRSIS